MLHEFIVVYREQIIERTRVRLLQRAWPSATASELETGVPLFLDQLSNTLRMETTTEPYATDAIGDAAAAHGGQLLKLGFTIGQVVHDYGDICQSITETALEQQAPVSVEEFHTLNRCLDTAIAEAVTEHARATAELRASDEVERLGLVAHEMRNFVNTALLAFHILKRGTVSVNGNTGAVLGRTLLSLRDFVDSTLSDVRLKVDLQRRQRVDIATFLNDVVAASALQAEYRGCRFIAQPAAADLMTDVDPQLLASAVTNLLNNAFKYSPEGGTVTLSATAQATTLVIAVDDECGGIPPAVGDPFQPFGERRGKDRTGLGLGLSIARKAVRAHGGDIHIVNRPGVGCTFSIEIPVAEKETAEPR
jgi:signal transduction histidine kinase